MSCLTSLHREEPKERQCDKEFEVYHTWINASK